MREQLPNGKQSAEDVDTFIKSGGNLMISPPDSPLFESIDAYLRKARNDEDLVNVPEQSPTQRRGLTEFQVKMISNTFFNYFNRPRSPDLRLEAKVQDFNNFFLRKIQNVAGVTQYDCEFIVEDNLRYFSQIKSDMRPENINWDRTEKAINVWAKGNSIIKALNSASPAQ